MIDVIGIFKEWRPCVQINILIFAYSNKTILTRVNNVHQVDVIGDGLSTLIIVVFDLESLIVERLLLWCKILSQAGAHLISEDVNWDIFQWTIRYTFR